MKKTIMLLALLGLFAAVQGCEGKADVDDDGASISVD